MSKRVYWVPTEEWRAEEQARYDAYLAERDDDDGTLQIRVMRRRHRIREAHRSWWYRSHLNVRMRRAEKRLRRRLVENGISPSDPKAITKLWARYHLQRGQR